MSSDKGETSRRVFEEELSFKLVRLEGLIRSSLLVPLQIGWRHR